mgnify:CR=1 FL=1
MTGPQLPVAPRRARDNVAVNDSYEWRPAGALVTRAASVNGTFDDAAYTVDAIVATATPVMRRDAAGPYAEVLEPAGFRLPGVGTELDVPLVDEHQRGSARHVIGRAYAFRLEDGNVVATLRFSVAPDVDPIVQRVRDGTLKHFSVGYRVAAWRDGTEGGRRTRTATDWQISEVSLVGQPADPNAQRIRHMEPDELIELEDDVMPPADAARIRSLGELADLPPSVAEGLITRGATIDEARTEIRSALIERSRSTQRIRVVSPAAEDPAVQYRAMEEALHVRVAGGDPSEAARPFVGYTLRDFARAAVERAGTSTRMMDTDQLFRAAMHTTSDFPNLLTGVGRRTLLASYTAAASPLKALARQGSRTDFRSGSTIRLGELGALQKLTEAGEIKSQSRAEAAESYALDTYASLFSISRKALINDDLGAFNDWANAAGQAAALTEANLLFDLLTQSSGAGPKMSDGKRLFHADHGNLLTAASLAVDGVNSLSDARLALRQQTGLGGARINVVPKTLLVGPELETPAEKLLTALNAAQVGDVNPWAGKLTLAVEPRIEGAAWYLFADPASVPVLEYSYLSSAPGPQIASREGWEVLSVEQRVHLDFGAGAVDWRGAVYNPGE